MAWYDLSASQSAYKAVENSGNAIAIKAKDGDVFAVESIVTSKLYEPASNKRIFNMWINIKNSFVWSWHIKFRCYNTFHSKNISIFSFNSNSSSTSHFIKSKPKQQKHYNFKTILY